MKKNAMLKVAAGLMVAVLLTTCAVSSTFAKYVTPADTFGDPINADVADWKLTLAATTDGMFAKSYTEADAGETGDKVIATASTNILAPGLSDSGSIGYTLGGTSDVAFRINLAADIEIENFTDYCPIVFTVGTSDKYALDATSGATTLDGLTARADGIKYVKTTELLETALENAIASVGTKEYAPGAQSATVTDAVAFGWSWAFESADPETTDVQDTELGKAGTGAISIKVAIGAEQIVDFTDNNT